MLVNLKEFYRAVTGEPYRGNTEKAVHALERWKIPMVIPSNLPAGARMHRRVDVAHVDKAKAAYAMEQQAKAIVKGNGKAKEAPAPGAPSHNLALYNMVQRVEAKLDKLLAAWGVQP